jgi:hypothetical protein
MSTQHERLVEAMNHAGKSWNDVKQLLRLTRAGIKKWRDGNFQSMTAENVFALSDFLGCDPRWLAIGEKTSAGAAMGAFGQIRRVWLLANDEGQKELLHHAEYVASQPRFQRPGDSEAERDSN